MTAQDLDEPRMIYVGPVPPHLLRAETPEADNEAAPLPPSGRPVAALIAVAAGAALVAGIAIGVFVPPLFSAAAPAQAAAAPAPLAARTAESAMADGPAAPPASSAMPSAAPPRVAVALLAPTAPVSAGAQPANPCASIVSRADQDVCADPKVAAADRDLRTAYQHAVSAGAIAEARAGQIDWLLVREAAAQRSPAALEGAYRQRIAQLDALSGAEPPH